MKNGIKSCVALPPALHSTAVALLCAGVLLLGGCHSSANHAQTFNSFIQGLLNHAHARQNAPRHAAAMFDVANPDAQRAAIAWMARQSFGYQPVFLKAYQLDAAAPSPLVRGEALLALGGSGAPAVAPTLIKGLSDPVRFVRMCAAIALTRIHAPAAIPALLQHLRHDPDAQVRVYCAIALKQYATRSVQRALIVALNDRNVAVARIAWDDLIAQTGRRLPAHAQPWRQWLQTKSASP